MKSSPNSTKINLIACLVSLFSSILQAFGLYNIHSCSGVTEGGVLGAVLLFQNWWSISPAISGFILNFLCYFLGWKKLGRVFLVYSAVSTLGFSVSYKLFEQFPPLWPQLYDTPLLAAVLGAVFIGLGAGICIRIGGATCGDDALAMSLSAMTGIPIQWIYLMTDLTVLALSLTYIPISRLAYSLLTVIFSGQLIGLVQRLPIPNGWGAKEDEEPSIPG